MTQLEYYTQLLKGAVLFAAWVGGIGALGAFALMSYYLYPWLRK